MAEPGGFPLPRLCRSVDFERVLARRRQASTEHFALHYLAAAAASAVPAEATLSRGLSTSLRTTTEQPVDDFASTLLIGAVVPKRHARRAVTRTLLKRAIYAGAERHRGQLAPGWWVVRLRGSFDRAVYVSAASSALRTASRDELDNLFIQAGRATS